MTLAAAPELDLDPESRRALEFDGVLEHVAGFARTPMGARRVAALAPLYDAHGLEAELEAVSQTERGYAAEGNLIPGGIPDPGRALRVLVVEGTRLEPGELRDLATLAIAASRMRKWP